ncbi:hypothetical protein SAMN05216228_11473 [Rhizobium tibeticum]|uniref:Transposase n=1 Tax=Rhizobium tibeticum TaxID=501024 RepID=A0ABY1AZ97_9HYPH|nr:hypothetical protein SAMN05216228_11473 [Rhizobium tibeticum]
MRGSDVFLEQLFTMKRLEDFVPADHPLRPIRLMANEALVRLDGLFSGMYACSAKGGRPSIAPAIDGAGAGCRANISVWMAR